MDPSLAITIVTGLLSAGAAFGGAKSALNGTRKKVEEVAVDVKIIRTELSAHGERLAIVETIVDRRVEDRQGRSSD